MNSAQGWFYWALLSAVFASLSAIFAKVGLQGVNPDFATLLRTLIILLVMAGFVELTGKWSNPLVFSGKTWGFLVLSGLVTGASWVCYFRALKIGRVSQVAPIDKLSLLLAALLAFIFLGERLSGWQWLGVLLMAAGVVVLGIKR